MDFLGNFVYYFIDNGLEIIQIVIVFITFFGMRAELTRKNVFLSLITLILFSLFWTLEKQTSIFVILYILFTIVEVYILYNYNEFILGKLLFKGFWCLVFINIIDAMVYNSIKSIFGYFNSENVVIIKLFTYIIVLLFLFVVSKLIKEKVKFVLELSTKFYLIYLFVGFADYIILSIVFLILEEVDKRELFVCITVSVSILFQYILILLTTIANEGLKYQHYLNQKYLHVQQENYEYLEYREEETKKFRHDYRNHLNSLQILCKERRYYDVQKYIEEISERLNGYNMYISVCNSFVDAILNYYLQKMNKLNVRFIISGKMPSSCNIVMFDLCTIISNLLDNALEAVEKNKEDDRWIEMTFRYDDLMIYCNIINPYDGELNIFNNKIISKKNSKNHGYGLGNVKRSVELYSGSIDIKTENGMFKVLIALVNKEEINTN